MRMKRLPILFTLLVTATSAFAFDASRGRVDRIGVLATEDIEGRPDRGAMVRSYLAGALRGRGLDAFNVNYTYDDLVRDGRSEADLYVELVGDADERGYGGVGVGGNHGGVDLAVIRNYTSAWVRVYDGRTFQIIDTFDLSKESTAVVPTAIGVGGRHVGLWIALPFVQYARHRAAARAVASAAANLIAEVSRDEASVD
jgi:hypothetical protein